MSRLQGIKQIAAAFNRSEPTILKLIREYGLPAKKIGGIWESDEVVLNDWRRRFLEGKETPGRDDRQKLKKQGKKRRW